MYRYSRFEIILQDNSAWTPGTSLPHEMYGLRTVSVNNVVIATGAVTEFYTNYFPKTKQNPTHDAP